ncbi:MAG TPA: thioredoxin family protein [Casimicrobiaceae bacterium]|jgi:thioredoxin reductase (NADPH)
MSSPSDASPLHVAVLCAAWCRSCTEFRPLFDALAAARPSVRFAWIDIEDEAAICDDLDIDDFPTLAVVRDGVPLFFGPSLPLAEVMARLIDELANREAGDPSAWPAEVRALAASVTARGRG